MKQERGFTCLGLVIFITIMGLIAVSALQVGAIYQRREAEQQLLEIGKDFYDALNHYSDATPAGHSPYPTRLEDLIYDPRFPNKHRYLRKIPVDPTTGSTEWGILVANTASGTGIVGVHSMSDAVTIKRDNFEPPFEYFRGKKTYREWVFSPLASDQSDPNATPNAPNPNANQNPGGPPTSRPPPPGKH